MLDWTQALRQVTSNLTARIKKLETLEQEPTTTFEEASTSNLILTTSNQDVPGAVLTLPAGLYLVTASFDFLTGNDDLDNGETARGVLDIDGVDQASEALATLVRIAGASRLRSQVNKTWAITLPGPAFSVVTLQARKSGGTGTSLLMSNSTTLTMVRLAVL